MTWVQVKYLCVRCEKNEGFIVDSCGLICVTCWDSLIVRGEGKN